LPRSIKKIASTKKRTPTIYSSKKATTQKLSQTTTKYILPYNPNYLHRTKTAAEEALYTQTKDSIDTLDAALAKLRQREVGPREVTSFMEKLQLFHTNTELGNDHLCLLFYPPSAALKSGFTLGNA